MIRCPLCLEDIRPGATLFRYCAGHQDGPTKIVYDGKSLDGFGCVRDPRCNSPQELWAGVFLSHEECAVRNPFWNGTQLVVTTNLQLGPANIVQVAHAQLGVLGAIATRNDALRQMWFPLGLFRSFNEKPGAHRLVMLAGPKHVGKTILSTMAMNPWTYQAGQLANYHPQVYIALGGVSSLSNFLQALYTVEQLQRGQRCQAPVPPTNPEEVHIKTVFLASRPRSTVREHVCGLIRSIRDLVTSRQARLDPEPGLVHPAVTFFDHGGERFGLHRAFELEPLARKMDVVAAVMEAPHLTKFGRDPNTLETPDNPDSVRHAVERLLAVPRDVKRCLIVTKLDLVSDEDAKKHLNAMGTNELQDLEPGPRDLLLSWLKDSRVETESSLARLVKSDDDELRVFFVSTYGVDQYGVLGGAGEKPRSVGLQRFLLWVLGWL